jgi:hypothetical protein
LYLTRAGRRHAVLSHFLPADEEFHPTRHAFADDDI